MFLLVTEPVRSLSFRGLSVASNDGATIGGLLYEIYQPMAERMIRRIVEELDAEHPCHAFHVVHRHGLVPVGEAAIYVRIEASHRSEAIKMLELFMNRLKAEVPIWKSGTCAMLSVDQVCSLIDREVRPLPAVRLPLAQALGHDLAEEIRADADMPAFDRSAIDGYALPEDALPGWFHIVGEVTPGMPPFSAPASGSAVRIFTGSALPGSGVGLVMVEETESEGKRVLTRVAASRQHVRARGSQAKRGELLLQAGTRVNPGAIALLASVGVTSPLVSNTPRIMHLVTGSELVAADVDPPPGYIRDSNSPLVAALIAEAGPAALPSAPRF